MPLLETLKGIAKAILPRQVEEVLGLTPKEKAMEFPVEAEAIRRLAEKTAELEAIGLPFTTKEWLIPKIGPEKFIKEWVFPTFLRPYSNKVQNKIEVLKNKGVEPEKAERFIIKRELIRKGILRDEPGWELKEITPEQLRALQRHELFTGAFSALDVLPFIPIGRIAKVPVLKTIEAATKELETLRKAIIGKVPGTPEYERILARARELQEIIGKTKKLPPKPPIEPPPSKPIQGLPSAPKPPDQVIKAFEEIKTALSKAVQFAPEKIISLAKEHQRVNTLVADLFRRGIVDVEQIPQFKNLGFTGEEAAEFIERFATFGGQDLNRISQWQKRMADLLPADVLQHLKTGKESSGFFYTLFHKLPTSFINAWRASLVSQLATAVRNATVSLKLFTTRIVEDAIIGATKTITGKAPTKRAFAPMIQDMVAVFNRLSPEKRTQLARLLEENPLIKFRLYATPINDVALMDKYSKVVTVFNRTQEFAVRNLVFDAVLRGELAKKGLELEKLAPHQVPVRDMLKAVDEALKITMAAPPKGFFREAVRLWNQTPTNILNILIYPFPRYLSNAVRTIYEYSPLGITRFLNPKDTKLLLKGDEEAMRRMARVFIGTIFQMAALKIRNDPNWAGEKWYQIKWGKRTIDVRPFGPLIPTYLFIAEALSNPRNLGVKDWIEGLLGIRRLAGTSLFMISLLEGSESWENLKKTLARISGDFIKGWFTPVRTFKDIVAQLDKEEAIVRYTRHEPLLAFLNQIPYASRKLPAFPSMTRAEPLTAELPLVKQLTGISFQREKNFLEKEMDRLGIPIYQMWPKTGYPEIDRLIAEKTGFLMEKASEVLEKSKKYQEMDDFEKEETIRELFSRAKRDVKPFVLEKQKERIAKEIYDEVESFSDPRDRKNYLKKIKRNGLLTPEIIEEILKLKNQ